MDGAAGIPGFHPSAPLSGIPAVIRS